MRKLIVPVLLLPIVANANTITVEAQCFVVCQYDLDDDGVKDAEFRTAPLANDPPVGYSDFFPYSYPPDDSHYLDGWTISTNKINVTSSATSTAPPGYYFYPLIVDFYFGAEGSLQFGSGFYYSAIDRFEVYDANDNLLSNVFEKSGTRISETNWSDLGGYWNEEIVTIEFDGIASYAIIEYDILNPFSARYMVDNVTGGIIGSAAVVPLPGALFLFLSGIAWLVSAARQTARK